jgi:hypothetical protein
MDEMDTMDDMDIAEGVQPKNERNPIGLWARKSQDAIGAGKLGGEWWIRGTDCILAGFMSAFLGWGYSSKKCRRMHYYLTRIVRYWKINSRETPHGNIPAIRRTSSVSLARVPHYGENGFSYCSMAALCGG